MTPDGGFIFTVGSSHVFRFEVSGTEIKFQETSPFILSGPCRSISISQGGDYLCAPSGGGNQDASRLGKIKGPYSTYVIPTDSLQTCELVLSQGAYPRTVGFDLQSGLLYSQNHDKQLLIFDTTGEKLKELRLDSGDDRMSAIQHLVHPQGRKLIIMADASSRSTTGRLWYVELPIGRKWTDSSGAFSVNADLIEVKNSKAYLRAANGKKLSILLEKLSEADRQYLESTVTNKAAEP